MANVNFINGVPVIINGDRVVQFTNSKKIKQGSFVDSPSLFSWYKEKPEDNHLGLIDLFSNTTQVRVPLYREIFANKQILEVNGINGRITYDLPVTKKGGIYTAEDTSGYSDFPGIDGGVFPIVLTEEYTKGDHLNYSKQYGSEVVVSEDYDVEYVGENFKHWVKLVSNDRADYFPADKLKAGIQYFKVNHSMGEYSVHYSGLESGNNVGTIQNEFILGNHRGVEVGWSHYANKKNFGALELKAADMYQKFLNEYPLMAENDMFMLADVVPGGNNPAVPNVRRSSVTLGSTMEFLALAEYIKIEANALLFGKSALIEEANGTKRTNEGLWHQWRRGRLIKYSRPNGLTENHIREAASYIFQSRPDLQYYDRKLKFKCGWMAYQNMLALFDRYVVAQTTGLSLFMGADRALPQNPISGSSLTNLSLSPVVFTEVPIPGIGMVQIEHDPSLDYMTGSDRFSQGFNDYGYADTTYSLVIYDATQSEYSNARTTLPQGTTLVEGGRKGSIYYVRPEGDYMCWGYEQGRMPDDSARGVVSSLKTMTRNFWVHGNSAFLNVDPSRTIIIELKRIGLN